MVASKLAGVTGGGRAYRVGGEEFSILFQGKSAKEAMPHLELLRSVVEVSTFRVRASQERRRAGPNQNNRRQDARSQDFRGHDRRSAERRAEARRAPARGTPPTGVRGENASLEVSVTVSIGVAEPNARTRAVEHVIQAADKALYRAKQSGRNRVESAASRPAKLKRSIA
jgi:GGDEF domain-containing protein